MDDDTALATTGDINHWVTLTFDLAFCLANLNLKLNAKVQS